VPGFSDALAPVLNSGAQGVDLFFILSGFVLTWNYLQRMGPGWSTRATLHFLWLRLARVWPVYLVTLHLAAAWIVFTLHVGHIPSEQAHQLTAISYVRQLLLMQLWFQPFFDGSSWDGPAWSISAEWLAYLLFGLLIVVIFRMAHATSTRGLVLLALAASTPPVLLLVASGHLYTPWSWLPRIVMQFLAGALACAAVRKLRLSDGQRRGAGYLSALVGAAIVGTLFLLDAYPLPGIEDSGGVVDLLFVPFVITLAAGAGSLPAVLSTRLMVYGGHISFGIYMVHELVHTAWTWAAAQFELTLRAASGPLMLLAVFAATVGSAALLFHLVEEPARKWMRTMVDPPRRAEPPHTVSQSTTCWKVAPRHSRHVRDEARAVAGRREPAMGRLITFAMSLAMVVSVLGLSFTTSGSYRTMTRESPLFHVAVIGDSYTNGTDEGGLGSNGWPTRAWQTLARQGVQIAPDVAAEGAAGYVVEGNRGSIFVDLVARAVHPDDALVVFFGSRNDHGVDPDDLAGHAGDAFTLARRIAPSARLLVIGPPWPTADVPDDIWQVRDVLNRQSQLAGATFVDPLAARWFVGAPMLIGADGVHPTDAGHTYLGDRIAPLIAAQLPTTV
jgi:peptidoglycan/LPS O-acetylase OafA/YrhL/lysophospholipase L1-like esterase